MCVCHHLVRYKVCYTEEHTVEYLSADSKAEPEDIVLDAVNTLQKIVEIGINAQLFVCVCYGSVFYQARVVEAGVLVLPLWQY